MHVPCVMSSAISLPEYRLETRLASRQLNAATSHHSRTQTGFGVLWSNGGWVIHVIILKKGERASDLRG